MSSYISLRLVLKIDISSIAELILSHRRKEICPVLVIAKVEPMLDLIPRERVKG